MGKATVSYQQFDKAINQVAHKLAEALPARRRVAVHISTNYSHWLVVLALARLGHVSGSISHVFTEAELNLLKPDVVLTDQPVPAPWSDRSIRVGVPWIKAALSATVVSPVAHRPQAGDPARIVMSSGTTGTPKIMLFTHGLIVRRIKSGIFGQAMRVDSPLMVRLGIATFGGFGVPLRTWYFGGTVCLADLDPDVLIARRITGLVVSPQQLRGLLRSLPPDFTPLPDLSVTVGGSALPEALATETRLRLTPNVIQTYGSTETTTVAYCPTAIQTQSAMTGIVLPWVELQVVDEAGVPVPYGTPGEVRIRCDDMVDGYFEDEEATRRAFRDGWFHPGDVGTVTREGFLKIIGRTDDLMNLGGNKIAPEPLERVLSTCPGIEDVAVFAAADTAGIPRPWAAIVQGKEFRMEELQEISARCEPRLKFRYLLVPAIPRNEMGKIERYKLRETLARRLKARERAAS
jgi:acyl-CoA synthetase (AMP-forming)/AMP-acid ligase II